MPTETLMMKDSKIEWIGEIPNKWNIKKIKHISNVHSSVRIFEDEYKDQGIPFFRTKEIVELANNKEISLELYISEDKYKTFRSKKVEKGDLLISSIGTIGEVWISDGRDFWYKDGNITQIDRNPNFVSNYLRYLISSNIFIENIKFYESTTTISALTIEKIKEVKFPLPDKKEQQAIAVFLDEKCEKIDKVIGEIEEQIQVLEDYKKSLITETVTKGLDKNVPMKDSGIDWIGKIPRNWQIKKIKYLFKVINGSTPDSDYLDYWDGDITWITPADMPDFGYISKGERSITLKGYKSCGTTLVPFNSIVLSSRAPIGKINITEDTLCTNQGCKCLVSNNLCNKYYYYFLYSQKEQLIDAGRGTTFIELSTYSLSNFYALLPPIKIQEQIAGYLDKECTKIDKTINDKKEQLETIKEYKKSLIYEYVTGKKRVAC